MEQDFDMLVQQEPSLSRGETTTGGRTACKSRTARTCRSSFNPRGTEDGR